MRWFEMEEDKLIINKDFAKSYNKYRRAEELQKRMFSSGIFDI